MNRNGWKHHWGQHLVSAYSTTEYRISTGTFFESSKWQYSEILNFLTHKPEHRKMTEVLLKELLEPKVLSLSPKQVNTRVHSF